MPKLPSALCKFLFSDIEGSTRLSKGSVTVTLSFLGSITAASGS